MGGPCSRCWRMCESGERARWSMDICSSPRSSPRPSPRPSRSDAPHFQNPHTSASEGDASTSYVVKLGSLRRLHKLMIE